MDHQPRLCTIFVLEKLNSGEEKRGFVWPRAEKTIRNMGVQVEGPQNSWDRVETGMDKRI